MSEGGKGALAPLAATLAAVCSFAAGAAFAKGLFPLAGPEGMVALRVVFAALILVAVRRPWRIPLDRRQAMRIVAYGAVLGTMNLLFYMAIRRVPVGLAIAIEFTGPLSVAILASRRRSDLVWAGLAGLGVFLLLPIAPGVRGLDPLGVVLALGAATCWALYIVLGQRVGTGHQGQAAALGMCVAGLVVAPFGLVFGGPQLFAPQVLAGGLLVAVMSSALPYSLEMFALSRLPRNVFGVLMSLEPAVGAIAGFLLLGEHLRPPQLAALGCIMAASAGAAVSAGRTAAPAKTL